MTDPYRRPSLDEHFLEIAAVVGKRGTCDRGRLGVVLVRDKRVLATGYVGAPAGMPHCDDNGHEMSETTFDGKTSQHCVRTSHSEINAICNAARYGIAIDGATSYGKFEPCYGCAKAMVNAGIVRVVCEKRYHAADRSRELFRAAGIELVVMKDEVEEYPDQ